MASPQEHERSYHTRTENRIRAAFRASPHYRKGDAYNIVHQDGYWWVDRAYGPDSWAALPDGDSWTFDPQS